MTTKKCFLVYGAAQQKVQREKKGTEEICEREDWEKQLAKWGER